MISTALITLSIVALLAMCIPVLQRFKTKSNRHSLRPNVRNIYILRTHIWNEYVESTFQKFQQQFGAEKVFLLYDETNKPIDQPHVRWNDSVGITVGPAILTVNEADCKEINALHDIGRKAAGSVHRVESQLYACYKAIKCDYDYMWFVEFDVYSNNYKKALEKFDWIEADMLTKGTANNRQEKIRTVKRNKDWFWWQFLVGEIDNTPMTERRGCFFPINRFSKRFLSVLEQNLSKSSGYCEVYFPTLCHTSGLVLKTMPLNTFGTFTNSPNITPEKIRGIKQDDTRLYHPVKEIVNKPVMVYKHNKSFLTSETLSS